MAEEPFLINPPRRLKRRRIKVRRRRRRNPVGETLVTVGSNPFNPWYGNSAGHRRAAMIRWHGHKKRRRHRKRGRVVIRHRVKHRKHRVHRKRGRWASRSVRMRRKIAQQAFWTSKYGHMLAHPRSKKIFTRKGFRTMARRKRRKNTWFGQPRRHRRAAKRGWRRGHMLHATGRRRGRKHRVRHRNPMFSMNPRRRHHRRHRRNPAIMAEFGKFTSSMTNVREWGPLAVTGGLSAITGAVAPSMLGVDNQWMRLGVQTAVAIGGGIVVERFVGQKHGQAWMIVGVAMVGYQLLKQFVFVPYFPQFAVGLGNPYAEYYPSDPGRDSVSQEVGAFPSLSAFPNMSGYPGVGSDEVGAYPYDGTPY